MTKSNGRQASPVSGFTTLSRRAVARRLAILVALVLGVGSVASAETLLMPPRDFLAGNAAQPAGPGSTGEVVWGVTTLPNHTAGSPTTYVIHFGDGTPDATGNVTDRSYIAVNHAFLGSGELTVTLTVTHAGVTETATTNVRVFNGGAIPDDELRGVNTNRAIENGLRYLWQAQSSRGTNFPDSVTTTWGGSYPEVYAALIVLAFENHGYKLPNDDTLPTGVYEKYIVRRGMNYIVNGLESFTMSRQGINPPGTPSGTPLPNNPCVGEAANDPNASTGACTGLQQNDIDPGYATSIAILPLAGSNALQRVMTEVATVSGSNPMTQSSSAGFVKDKTIGEIVQRLVDGLAWGQGESGFGRGGWYYTFNAGGTDGSTMGWNVLALLDAEAANIEIPPFMKSELLNYAAPNGLNSDGTFDYSVDGNPSISSGGAGRNMAKTGIGLQVMYYMGIRGLSQELVAAGRNSVNIRWNGAVAGDTHPCGMGPNKGCAYAMFNVFKGLKLQNITTIPNVNRPAGPGSIPEDDWYADYVDWLLANQGSPTSLTGGNWPTLDFSCCGGGRGDVGTAALAELILAPVALIAPDPLLFSTVGLGPSTALLAPFGTHTVTATATSAGGAGVPGATVNFVVLSGPNVGRAGQATTDADGKASFTYSDTGGPGRDTIRASIGTLNSNIVEALWQVPACDAGAVSIQLSSPIFPIDQGWRGVTINGAPGAKVTQVCQDEPPNFENIAAWAIDADGVGTSNASIRAQRSGTRSNPGNGRVYTIYFTAAACTGSVTVGVPTAPGGTAVNEGPRYNSVSGASCAVPAVPSIGSVPNVIGKTESVAASDLAAAGLTLGAVAQLNSPSVPYGEVMSQNPGAGTAVALGSAVSVTVSSGPASVAAPNVVNTPQTSASSAISTVGLTPVIQQVNDNVVPAGIVISQSPLGGTQLPPGTSVVLQVSSGKATSIVPNVVGLTLAGAVSAVGGAGLNFGNVNLVYNDHISDGMVFAQSPEAGTVLAPGAAIDFDVSLGPQPVPVPNLTGQTEADANASVAAASLSVGNVTHANDANVPAGHVINQTPAGGSLVSPGSSVNYAVSLGPVMVTVPDVVTRQQTDAQADITGVGLAVGTITHANHPSLPPGSVILQNPAAGASAPLHSTVALTISLGPTPVLVPNLIGQTQPNATNAILAATLTPGAVTTAHSPTVPSGNVMGQNPLAGQSVLPGTPVSFVVSSGPVIVTVPNVVGQLQADAQSAISSIGLFLQSITFTTNPAPAGQVIAQSPSAGANAVLGSPMQITVSLGSNSVTVPNVIGKTQASAGTLLAAAGLNVGTVTTTSHPTVPAGAVIDQSPAGSTVASQGSSVNLLVSVGPVSATVPNVLGSLEDDAVAAILAAHLGAMVTFGTSPTVTAGHVISQQPAAGASVGEGSTVTINVSTGLSAATIPNVLGMTQPEAESALAAQGLVLGSVTQQSSVKAAGLVIGQTPGAGGNAPSGTQVNLVLSTGPVAGEPAILELTLSTQVLSAGTGASITSSVLDGFTVPVVPTPGVTYQIVAGPGTTGTLPYVNGDQVLTSADTRGAYTLHGVIGTTVVTADVAFAVVDGAVTATNVTKFVKLGAAEHTVSTKIDDLLRAYQNLAPAADVTAAKSAMTAALLTVPITGRDAMTRSTAVAPEHGFLPSMGALAAAGFPLTLQDQAFGNLIMQIAAKLDQIKAFYLNLDPDALAGGANSVQQLTTLNNDLQALQTQLAGITPTPAGIVQYAPYINRLLGDTIPEHLHAVTNRVVSIATQYPDPTNLPGGVARLQNATDFFVELNARRQAVTPGAFYGKTQPAFFGLLGLMSGCNLQMKLVNDIYGPIMTEVSEMMAVLALNGLIENYGNTAQLGDLISGGSLSFQAPGNGGSEIEGYGFDATSAAGNETWFIGPEAFDLVKNLIQSFDPSDVESIQDVWDFLNGIADAVNATFEGYERAHTQPDDVAQGLCRLDDSFGCTSLYFNAGGFPDVNSTRFPSPVIVILNNKNNGSWSSGIFNFVP